MNHELSDVQDRFRKGRGTRDQIANIHWIIKKAREFQKNIYCFTDYAKALERGIPDELTCLLRNLYAGQESPCLFNLYAEYIMRNAGLDEAQPGIKIARRNINNLRYADDTILWQKAKN